MSDGSKIVSSPVSVVIFTLDEEDNLPTCLDSLEWCDDVHVVDSFSTDATEAICRRRGASFVSHGFEGFGTQRNWALRELDLAHDWVLILDADERVPPALAREICAIASDPDPETGAYRLTRRFHLWGRWLRHSSLYPTWVVRFVHRRRVEYVNRGHGETQRVDGRVGRLEGYLIDENLKGLDDWFERQARYARRDAEHELETESRPTPRGGLFSRDPLERRAAMKRLSTLLPFRAFFYFVYSYVFRFGFLDGRDGFYFCRMRALYQAMVEINKHDLRKACTPVASGREAERP